MSWFSTHQRELGVIAFFLLFLWTIALALLISFDVGDDEGTKVFSYVTYAVATLVTALGVRWIMTDAR